MKLFQVFLLLFFITTTAQNNYILVAGTIASDCDNKGLHLYDYTGENGSFKLKTDSKVVESSDLLTHSAIKNVIYSIGYKDDNSIITTLKYNPIKKKFISNGEKIIKKSRLTSAISDNKNFITVDASTGTIYIFSLKSDGGLSKQIQTLPYTYMNDDAKEGSFCTLRFSPKKKYVILTNTADNEIHLYDYIVNDKENILLKKNTVSVREDSHPGRFVLNPNGIFMYVADQYDAALSVYQFKKAVFKSVQEIKIAPKNMERGDSKTSIKITKDGKFLYVVNWGDANTITTFQVHANGKINLVDILDFEGGTANNFSIDPDENYLMIASRDSDTILVYERNKITGKLSITENGIELCKPSTLIFIEAK